MMCKEGDRKSKLVPKAEGPCIIYGFTDSSKKLAIIEDAKGISWHKRVANFSLWENQSNCAEVEANNTSPAS